MAQAKLSESDARNVATALSRVLADTYVLYLKTHGFHWNVEGPRFVSLHDALEEQYRGLWEALDDIAERIRALGHYAPASYSDYAELTSLAEERGVPGPQAMLNQLLADHERVLATLREARETADQVGDDGTVNLLDDRLVSHEKTAWMLRSLLAEPDAGGRVRDSVLPERGRPEPAPSGGRRAAG